MQQYIIRAILLIFLFLPFSCNGQGEQLGLTEEQYHLYKKGYQNVRSDPHQAIILLDSLMRIKPEFCRALAPLGLAYYTTENFSQATMIYMKFMECDPSKPISYRQLSRIYQMSEKYDSAELILLKWFDYQEEFPYADVKAIYSKLGEISRAKNQYHKSIEYLTEAINRCYDGQEYKYCGDSFYLRADSYSRIGEPKKALEDVLMHKKLNPEDRAALVLKGEILQLLERHEESNEILREYLLNPTHQGENWVNFMIGYNYNRLKEFEKSCVYLREAERLGYEHVLLTKMLEDCKP